jgi:hypothetical protein
MTNAEPDWTIKTIAANSIQVASNVIYLTFLIKIHMDIVMRIEEMVDFMVQGLSETMVIQLTVTGETHTVK